MKVVKSQVVSNKKLYILRGPSGTGKSTLAKDLGAKAIFSADDYFMNNDKYVFDANKLRYAHEQCQERTEEAMENGISPIAVDNTFTRASEIRPYMDYANSYGYSVEFVEPDWSSELRNEDGTWNADFIEKMQKNPDRVRMNKSLSRNIIDNMVNRYQYGLTPDNIL